MQTFDLAPISTRTFGWSLSILGVVLLVTVLAVVATLMVLQLPKVEVGADGLRVRSYLFGRTIPLSRLDLDAAHQIDAATSPQLEVKWRTNGIGLPGYKAGWFTLQNGGKALLFVTDPMRQVYIPTTDDYALIVSPADPAAFLAALKAAR